MIAGIEIVGVIGCSSRRGFADVVVGIGSLGSNVGVGKAIVVVEDSRRARVVDLELCRRNDRRIDLGTGVHRCCLDRPL